MNRQDRPDRSALSPRPDPELRPAGAMLRTGRSQDRAGRLDEAIGSYERAVLIETLRRLGVVHHRRDEDDAARELCRRSYREAVELGDLVLAGEALNALAGFEFEAGEIAAARGIYLNALALAGTSAPLRGRIEQNLGILVCIQGDHATADEHYRRSLEAFEGAGDERGSALAYHNLGMIASRRGELEEAERAFTQSAAMAARAGDVHLDGLCELNRAEVCHGRQQYTEAMRRAEAALSLFERMGDRRAKSDAYHSLAP